MKIRWFEPLALPANLRGKGQELRAFPVFFHGKSGGHIETARQSQDPGKRRQAVDRAEKHAFVEQLNQVFNDTTVVVVAHYKGLTVSQMGDLRGKMQDAGATVKVAKNRLAKLALQGTEIEHITDLFTGPTLIAYSDDPVAAPKVVSEFAKSHDDLVVLGGAFGETRLDVDGVKALATMPSLDELRAKIIAMVNTPASRIAQVVNAPAGQLARVVDAYAKKGEAA